MWRAVSVSFRGARRFSAAAAAQPAVRLVLQRKKLTSTELATAEAAMDAASAEDLKKLLAAGFFVWPFHGLFSPFKNR
jgi:hypothetical protein